MRTRRSIWLWRGTWGLGLLVGLGVFVLYAWLPADGATGDLESFTPEGFRVQWLLERREAGLRVGDVIVRAGGHTVEEWLEGAVRGPEWRSGGDVSYEILRDGQRRTLQVRLVPVSLRQVLSRWAPQLVGAVAFLSIGTFVFWKRPGELSACVFMLFCVTVALQCWGDAYNFQYATLPWRWPFWLHLTYEQLTYSVSVATVCYFALLFPAPHPVVRRFPRLVPSILYVFPLLAISGAMALTQGWIAALAAGNRACWVAAVLLIGLAIAAGIRSARIARDPVSRAQIRWIVWSAGIGVAVCVPGYVLPLLLGGRPLLSHPAMMAALAIVPFSLGAAILRYRLFDIEVIINWTLVYGTLTAILGGLYVLLVRLLTLVIQRILHAENETAVVFVATLCIALAFAPLRRRVQAVIDRAFFRTRLDYQRLLAEMSARLATSILPDDLIELLTAEVPRRLQIASATLVTLDLAGERLVRTRGRDKGFDLAVDHPLVEFLEQQNRPVLHLQPPPRLPSEAQAFMDQERIELSIPLVVGPRLVGLYSLGPKLSGEGYDRREVRLLHLLGQQAAVAVENSRLVQAEREQRRLSEALQEAAAVVSGTLDLDRVLDRILEQVERVVAGDAFNIMLIEQDTARVVRWRGYDRLGAEERIANIALPLREYPTLTRMIQSRRPVLVADAAADPNWVDLEGWGWMRSYLSAPILVAGLPVGFLNVDGTRPGQFDTADLRLLDAFAHHAATAIENARLYQETARRLAQTEVLREVMLAAASTLDFDEVLTRTCETLETMMRVEFLGFALPDEEGKELWLHPALIGYATPVEGIRLPLEGSVCGQVFQTGEPLIVADVQAVPFRHRPAEEARSGLAVPVRVGERVIGVLSVESSVPAAFDVKDLAFYATIAGQLGAALENARLYEETRRQASELAAAVTRLQELDLLKSEFIQNVSHELRSPLALIRGYAELLTAGELGELESEQRAPVEVIARRASMLGDLVEDITHLLAAEAHAMREEPTALDELVRAAVEDFSVAADRAGLTLKAEIAPNLSLLWGAPLQLRRVVDNLVGNAIKFTPKGGEVTVRLRQVGAQIVLEVSDTGIGIPPDQRERVFERFYQVDGSARRRYGGVGLGLALVKEIVEAHGGRVSVESRSGEGSTFSVALPTIGESVKDDHTPG